MSFPDFNYNPIIPDPPPISYYQERERLEQERIERERIFREKYPPGTLRGDREKVIDFLVSLHPHLERSPNDQLCKITDKYLKELSKLQC